MPAILVVIGEQLFHEGIIYGCAMLIPKRVIVLIQ